MLPSLAPGFFRLLVFSSEMTHFWFVRTYTRINHRRHTQSHGLWEIAVLNIQTYLRICRLLFKRIHDHTNITKTHTVYALCDCIVLFHSFAKMRSFMRHPKRKMGNCAGNTISEHRQPRLQCQSLWECVYQTAKKNTSLSAVFWGY